MSLSKYKEKRDFKKTSEPKAGKSNDDKALHFVVQKHDATRLHYDFRLEMEGVLKSWAVPKGPSVNPKDKRLAMMVEDHPYDYKDFEGIIPKGEYGGGTVIVWDEGTYEPIETVKGKKAQDKLLLKQLKEGSLKIKLHGQKLNGEFALVKTQGMGENGWLLIKHKDDYASARDITKEDKSVVSKKTIAQMEKGAKHVWKDGKDQQLKDAPEVKKKALTKTAAEEYATHHSVEALLKEGEKSPLPKNLKPMLATLVDKPFDDPDWLYEVKWDGYRAVSYVNKGGVEIQSRNNKSFNDKYYPLRKLMEKWAVNLVIDGEIVVLKDNGQSDFGSLQNWRSEADGHLSYYVFDLLWYEGKNLTHLTLAKRRKILENVIPADDDRIRLSQVFNAKGTEFFDAAKRMGLEGIIAKKADSTYTPGLHSKEWLKIKVNKRQEVVIGGFTRNEGTAKKFSSLLLGVYENGKLQYTGKVGTGFNDKMQTEMMEQFKPLMTDKVPFMNEPDYNKPSRFRPNPPNAKAYWLKPELVCEISFAEVTSDGVFRHPSFEGMRADKKARDVVREAETSTEQLIEETHDEPETNQKQTRKKMLSAPKDKDRRTLLNPNEETQVRKLNGHELKFTHLSKVYWPEDNVTKRDMFNYYYQVAEYILPYLKDRPQSLNRFPDGIHGSSFYQKDVKDKSPEWLDTFPYTSDGEHKEFAVACHEDSLLWMASLGCIEMNPWFSRVQSPDHPDYCVIDLDPDKHHFDQVIEAALEVKKVLDAIDVPCYPKTSGSTGMHIYIPMGAKYTYEQSQLFARIVVGHVHDQIPDFTTLERSIKKREGRMYLDFLQNRPGATIAGPYSLRPKPGATVSMPLHWEEVKPGLKMTDFHIFNAIDRLKETGDLFKGVLGKGIDLEKVLKKARSVFGASNET
ncbi:bifunctional non-homologous end joining protein LigD [Mucilaginibacter yixingensis]|uniref:DNA ligase (ATP) n=1 Tax=Mucilaginibacter yixingensis TaxID=1295612 RepID=A0A2T5JF63_9SPHI|nr:DNA ligase D [Mucilaginibacter yixingensis]PTR01080.1 bifunctional non-homologous end joining protein LigD [Mucilaginibacter yixingensis]